MGPGSSRRLDARHRQEQLPRRGTRTFPRCGLNGLRAGGPGSPGNDGFMSQPAIGLLLRIPRNCGSSRVFSAESGLARDCPAAGLSFVSRLGSSQDCCARDDPWVMIVCDIDRSTPPTRQPPVATIVPCDLAEALTAGETTVREDPEAPRRDRLLAGLARLRAQRR